MIRLQEHSASPIYEQIVEQLKALVAKGAMKAGDRVPSVRELSSMLLINPNTVSKAYQELERQGVIQTIRGKGTFVSSNEAPRMAAERLEALQREIRRLAVEAKSLGLSEQQWEERIRMESRTLWGDERAAD